MKSISKLVFLMMVLLIGFQPVQAQKKVQKFTISKMMNIPASDVWAIVGEDYGAIAKSHPKIIASEYINGSLKAGEGTQRVCYFNKKGTQFVKEKMVDYDPKNMTFLNQIFQTGKFPLDPEFSQAIYKVEDMGWGKSRFSFEMEYRTRPAFMGAMAKGKFKRLIKDYMTSVEHHIKTGESVTKENFKKIRKMYKA